MRRRRVLDELIAQVMEEPLELPEESVDSTELLRQIREEDERRLMRVVRGDA